MTVEIQDGKLRKKGMAPKLWVSGRLVNVSQAIQFRPDCCAWETAQEQARHRSCPRALGEETWCPIPAIRDVITDLSLLCSECRPSICCMNAGSTFAVISSNAELSRLTSCCSSLNKTSQVARRVNGTLGKAQGEVALGKRGCDVRPPPRHTDKSPGSFGDLMWRQPV